ncbi:MAG TPA: cobalamin-dependent protein [Candidatus Acidoferrales bacterium]
MTDILLTHGYFLSEDEKERQIMKPYPPLGLLYLSGYLKTRGHSVEVYDSTFGTRPELLQKIRRSPGGIVGVYTNLMTRGSVLQLIGAAKQSGSTVILGGPESANYSAEYLSAGADVIVVGEGESALTEVMATLPSMGPHGLNDVAASSSKVHPENRCIRSSARKSTISTRCRCRTAMQSIIRSISTRGEPITERAASISSRRAAALIDAPGARTPFTGTPTGAAARRMSRRK